MLAEQAKEIFETSNGLLMNSLDSAYRLIKDAAEQGKQEAWVKIPSELLLETFKLALVKNGYQLHNRQGFQLLVSF